MERSLTLPPSEPMNTLRRFGWLCKYQDLTDPGLRRHREYMVLWIGFFNESTGQAGGPISFFRQATQWLGRRITLFVLSLSISVQISPTKREGLSSLQKKTMAFCRDVSCYSPVICQQYQTFKSLAFAFCRVWGVQSWGIGKFTCQKLSF